MEVISDIIRPYMDEVNDRINEAEERAKTRGVSLEDEEDWDIPNFWEYAMEHWPQVSWNITWKSLRDVRRALLPCLPTCLPVCVRERVSLSKR